MMCVQILCVNFARRKIHYFHHHCRRCDVVILQYFTKLNLVYSFSRNCFINYKYTIFLNIFDSILSQIYKWTLLHWKHMIEFSNDYLIWMNVIILLFSYVQFILRDAKTTILTAACCWTHIEISPICMIGEEGW